VGFEPAIAVLERAKTVRALDRSATAIGKENNVEEKEIFPKNYIPRHARPSKTLL
jgi:hypothetical protein